MKAERKPTKEALTTRYLVRMLKRAIHVLIWVFVIFLMVTAMIWLVPKIWAFATS